MKLKADADAAAWIALGLSLAGVVWQIILWGRGADPQVIAPESVALYGQSDARCQTMIRIAAPVSLLNKAEPPYSSAVVDEWAVLQIGKFKSLQKWNGTGTMARARGGNQVIATGTALPQPLLAASGTSSFVLFVSGNTGKRCDEIGPCDRGTAELRPAELLTRTQVGVPIRLTILFEDVKGKRRQASCSRTIDSDAREELERLPQGVAYIRCDRDP